MAQQETMNILEFQKRFDTDEKCRDHLFIIRWPEGLTCPHCGQSVFYRIAKRNVYECKACAHQVSLTAGTIMHGSHTPLRKWFWAIYMVSEDKRGVSATRLQRELDVSYPTAWLMLHKIRKAMEDRDGPYKLEGIVELDETYMGGPKEGEKRGRGTEKTLVQVALSLNSKGNPLYIKMKTAADIKAESLLSFAEENIKKGAVISSDAYSSYIKAFSGSAYKHEPEKFDIKENPDHLGWLHRMVSNAKAFILGTYHGLGEKHLQAYLSEYCYRANRRQFKGQLFNRLLNACASTATIFYRDLVLPVLT